MSNPPKCSECGARAVRSKTQYGFRNDCCGLWSWGGYPLVDRDTHEARIAAHDAFDPLWRRGKLRRSDAYKALARLMGISVTQCHMKLMDATTARRVPALVQEIIAGQAR